jgi:hypothetical protein
MPDGPRLFALQELDTTLDQLQHQRPRLAEVSAHGSVLGSVTAIEQEIAGLRAEVATAEAAIASSESATDALTAKRARLEQQLKTIISPREAEALMNEIAGLDAQRAALEDTELEAMEHQGAAEAAIAVAESQLADRQQELATATAARDQAWAAIDARIAEVRGQRDTLAAGFSAEELTFYDGARARHQGVGFAHLEGTHCSGCHLDISRGEIDVIRALPAGELGECPQCNRYLVR